MSPERLIYLISISDALQCRLTFMSRNTFLKPGQVGYEIRPNRKNNHKNEQEQEGYSYARIRILIQGCFHRSPPSSSFFYSPFSCLAMIGATTPMIVRYLKKADIAERALHFGF